MEEDDDEFSTQNNKINKDKLDIKKTINEIVTQYLYSNLDIKYFQSLRHFGNQFRNKRKKRKLSETVR